MASKDFILNIIADIDDYQKELAKVPGYTEKSARAAALAFAKQQAAGFKKAGAQAKAAADDASKAWENVGKGLGYGGPLGDLKDLSDGFTALSGKAQLALGAIGGFAAAAVGAAAVAGAIVAAVKASEELIEKQEHLKRIEGFEPLDPDAMAAIKGANDGLIGLGEIVSRLVVIFAAEFAPALESVTDGIIKLGLYSIELAKSVSNTYDVFKEFGKYLISGFIQTLAAPVTIIMDIIENLGRVQEALGMGSALKEAGQAWDDLTYTWGWQAVNALEEVASEYINLSAITGVTNEDVEKFKNTIRSHTEALKDNGKAAKELAAANQEFNAAVKAAISGVLGEEQKIILARDEQIAQLDELAAKTGRLAEAELAKADLVMAAETKISEMRAKKAKEEQDSAEKIASAGIKAATKMAKESLRAEEDATKKRQEMNNKLINDSMQALNAVASAITASTSKGLEDVRVRREEIESEQASEIEHLSKLRDDALERGDQKEASILSKRLNASKQAHNKEIAQINAEEDRKKKAALAAFAITKALALTQIAINTARAIVEAAPNPFLMAAAGAVGAVNAAVVAAQPPPKFHSGGYVTAGGGLNPDEVDIRAKTGEFVVSTQGVRAAGGPDNLAALNRGEGMGGGQVVIQNVYGHRVFEAFVQDNLKMNGRLSRAVRYGRDSGRVASRTKKAV